MYAFKKLFIALFVCVGLVFVSCDSHSVYTVNLDETETNQFFDSKFSDWLACMNNGYTSLQWVTRWVNVGWEYASAVNMNNAFVNKNADMFLSYKYNMYGTDHDEIIVLTNNAKTKSHLQAKFNL